MAVSGHSFVEYKWAGDEWLKGAKAEIGRRLVVAGEHLKTSIQETISVSSNIGPSREGEPPHADTGQLRNSIYRTTDKKTLTTVVGTSDKKARWLEFGTRGQVRIVPKQAKALAIELTRAEAVRIANRQQYFARNKKGAVNKRGNSLRARMKRAGIKRNKRGKRKRGQYILLRSNVLRGPIRPRPFFRRTVNEQKRELARIMNRTIKVPVRLIPVNAQSAGTSGAIA